jgi:hypothetical protein
MTWRWCIWLPLARNACPTPMAHPRHHGGVKFPKKIS